MPIPVMMYSGAAVVPFSPTAWNPATTDTDLTLSGSDRVVTGNAGTQGSTYAVQGQSTGSYYLETTLTTMLGATQPNIGICNASFDYTVRVGLDAFSYSWASDGAIYDRGLAIAAVANYGTAGDVLSMFVNLGTNVIRFYGNGTLIYTGALAGVLAAGTRFPAIGKQGGGAGVGDVWTTNFGQSAWVYPLLATGATGWPS